MIRSAYIEGVKAVPVTIEVALTESGGFVLRGLSEAATRETRVRVKAAANSASVALPDHAVVTIRGAKHERIHSGGFDLPIALALHAQFVRHGLVLSEKAVWNPDVWAYGELSLSGEVRTSRGAELVAELAVAEGGVMLGRCQGSFHPAHAPVTHLAGAVKCVLAGLDPDAIAPDTFGAPYLSTMDAELDAERLDARLWRGLRGAMVAAVGGFGLLLEGPVGSGRTLLARRIPRLLPEPTESERRHFRRIASASGLPATGARPFRAPHHTASATAIMGGGLPARPGERTLADGGVLFFDELPDFYRVVLEGLGQTAPAGMPTKPAVFVAAMDLCPCGRTGAVRGRGPCTCKPMLLQAWQDRVAAFKKRHIQITVRLEEHPTTPSTEKCPLTIGQAREAVTIARRLLSTLTRAEWSELDRVHEAEVALRAGLREVLGLSTLEGVW